MMYCFNTDEREKEDIAAIYSLLKMKDDEGLCKDISHRVTSEVADERISKEIERKENARTREQKKTELRTATK